MRLAGYLRVSTRRQAVEGWSLPDQRGAIEEWAAKGHHAVVFFEDAGVSGAAPLDSRKGLLRALGCLYRGEVEGIVVARLDRLTRDLILQEQLLADIWGHGGVVLSCAAAESEFLRRDDPGDPSRRLIRQILGAVIEYNKSTSRLHLESCRLRKADAGGYVGGRPRYGWQARDKALVEVPEEQAVIARMKSMRERDRATLAAIAAALDAEGVPGPAGGRWSRMAVGRVLAAEGLSTAPFPRAEKPKKAKRKKRVFAQPKPKGRARPQKPHRVRRNPDGKAIIPRPEWRGSTEEAPW